MAKKWPTRMKQKKNANTQFRENPWCISLHQYFYAVWVCVFPRSPSLPLMKYGAAIYDLAPMLLFISQCSRAPLFVAVLVSSMCFVADFFFFFFFCFSVVKILIENCFRLWKKTSQARRVSKKRCIDGRKNNEHRSRICQHQRYAMCIRMK